MPHPLIQQLRTVARKAKRLLVLYGIAAVAAVLVVAALAAGLLDYSIGVKDPGVRLLLSLAVLVAVVASIRHFLVPGLRKRWDDDQIARRLEQRFPDLDDRLSSTVDFLNQPERDPRAGSAELRRAVIAETIDALQRLPVHEVIDATRPRRMALMAGILVLGLALLVIARPLTARVAMKRLLVPWHPTAWPRVHHLAFENPPQRVAVGSDVLLSVIDPGGSLPQSVTIDYGYADEDPRLIRSREMAPERGRVVYRVQKVTRNLRYRARGGDDDQMPWHTLQVVEPPKIQQLRIQLRPPAYTAWPAETTEGDLRVLSGTTAKLSGQASAPLAEVHLKLACGDQQSELAAALDGTGHRFHVPAAAEHPWLISQSGRYWLQLVDKDGLHFDTRDHVIHAVPDHEPKIVLSHPPAHQFTTANASVRIRAVVTDDLAIRTIQLRYQRSDRPNEQELPIPLFEGPEHVPSPPPVTAESWGRIEDTRQINDVWDLAWLGDVPPATTVSFFVSASDYRLQQSRSSFRHITIITAEQFQQRVDREQSRIAEQLAHALRLQRQAHGQVMQLIARRGTPEGFGRSGTNALRDAGLKQREVQRQLVGQDHSVQHQVDQLLAQLEQNHIEPDDEVATRLRGLLEALATLSRNHLAAIQQQLSTAVVACRDAGQGGGQQQATPDDGGLRDAPDSSTASAAPVMGPLIAAGRHQAAVAKTLQELLDQLTQSADYRRLVRQLDALRQQQGVLRQRTSDSGYATLGKEPDALSPQEQADLQALAQQQQGLARRLDQLLDRLRQIRAQVSQTDPHSGEAIEQALEIADHLTISSQMRENAHLIHQNRMGQATRQQRQVEDNLRQLADALRQRQRAARLRQSLLVMLDRQQAAIQKTVGLEDERARRGSWTTADSDRVRAVSAEQRKLADDVARLAGQIGSWPVFQLALHEARQRMTRAADRLAEGDTSRGTQLLEEGARRRLAQMAEALEPEPAGDSPPRPTEPPKPQSSSSSNQAGTRDRQMLAELKLMKEMQVMINRRTRELEIAAAKAGGLLAEQRQELKQLAAEQGRLAELIQALAREPVP